MKVTLVGINAKYIHSNLAVRYLKTYTEDLNYECKIMEFSINDQIERIVEEILSSKPDLVAFSCYIWNIEYVKAVSSLIKLVNSEIEILYGGPEVSFNCKEFLEENVGDYVIEGEGEVTYKEFIKWRINSKDDSEINDENSGNIQNILGLYYKYYENIGCDSKINYGGKRTLMDMEQVIFPYNEEELTNKIVYYEASRGCPFNCKYCLSSTTHGVRFLNTERVKRELKFLVDKKVKLIKFVDRTFNCNSRFAVEIWEFLIKMDTEITFHFEISADLLNKQELDILAKAPKGRFQFEVGVQTTNPLVLNNINRFVNFNDIKEMVEELEKIKNIKQHLDLIAGLPGENYESFKKSFNDVYSIHPEVIQLGFLKLLKGSDMRSEATLWGMVYAPYPPYEILKTRDISYEELVSLKRVEKIVDKYYNSQKFSTILKYFVKKFNTPFEFYYELGVFFYEKGYLSRNISSVDYYKIFIEFNEEKLEEEDFVLKEIVKYDYLKYNKKKWLPDFLIRDLGKKVERSIKDKLLHNNDINNTSNIHIEKFMIDILDYIDNNTVRKEDHYLVYDINDEDNIKDITSILD
ncbi:B12-binding domain-containing radical SAM protein [Clostridium sp. CM028]|uniref:B12-binding domain-containing radical SAM protein n=1 Tax=unclassified Clostridium TaxID=2614128 RepID=UPI001C6E5DA3|nr:MULTISPECIES: B12-binding domain-containing radical SAM protein [unclassified Clostridium]MBW9144393.1 B12-binding domain-containing radical SAM protein [Clostridium sp. CM027]MBW9149370.1 B12-binding domain-containing radical SAM protein [Clostridium sp. CM028]UVE40978.1 B12-binding domain-containing radical SAM protein [Clostridium sp. CM027]WLC61645.1 B12-binding domain-containing radical SAM protein [Clostridium sp. CM028]